MTRYTKYSKQFNTTTIAQEQEMRQERQSTDLSREESRQIEQDKNQNVNDLYFSRNMNSSKAVCLKCRKRGHSVRFCPEGTTTNICYNCGSTQHSLKECTTPRTDQLAFASCFVCNQKGHLASKCDKNENGIYPRGGGCRFCGSKHHLARDCKPIKGAESGFIGISTDPKKENPDDDLMFSSLKNIQDEKDKNKKDDQKSGEKVKRVKVVKF